MRISVKICGLGRLLPKVLVKKALNALKAVLVFCQKSAKIMLIFLKVLVGYKKMLTFSDFFNHRTLHFSDFHLQFSSTKCNDQCFFPIRSCMLFVLCITVPPSFIFSSD